MTPESIFGAAYEIPRCVIQAPAWNSRWGLGGFRSRLQMDRTSPEAIPDRPK
jgi:hypothetical protein